MKDLNYFRNKIKSMDFTPMSDEEIDIFQKKYEKAINNLRLEDSYETDEERLFFQMLIQERVPEKIRVEIIKDWIYRDL